MVLVRVRRSAISPGTESASVSTSGTAESLIRRAIANPILVKQVIDRTKQAGISDTLSNIRGRLNEYRAIGYSAAGTVVEVGDGVFSLKIGDRVACAGVGYANHAEYVAVPTNLVAKVPPGVSMDEAAFSTLGAIAMQGVRQLAPSLGETVVVVGLGVIGQLAVQLAVANGCRVIGADLHPVRAKRAMAGGASATWSSESEETLEELVRGMTGDVGADGVLLTAATSSSELINEAFGYSRDRGRVVVVGDVGLSLERPAMFRKEIELKISRSYGPGRYDATYEEGGLEYPIGYVRWTEQRNLGCFLDLIARKRVDVHDLIDIREPVERATLAYEQVTTNKIAIAAVLEYGEGDDPERDQGAEHPAHRVRVGSVVEADIRRPRGSVGIGLIGAGGFFKAVHLPNLKGDSRIVPVIVATRSSLTGRAVADEGGFPSCTTDWHEVIADAQVDAVLIMTRHHLHAEQTLAALAAGKHVFVEKPLAISTEDCRRVVEAQQNQVVVVGFNRRFAPAVVHLRQAISTLRGPKHLLMRVNAGRLPATHWIYGPEGGGRIFGEGCHFFDLLRWLVSSKPVRISAGHTSGGPFAAEDHDNLSAIIEFDDGSIATLIYAASGSTQSDKERIEVYADGSSLILDDYRSVMVRGTRQGADFKSRRPDKGHRAILGHFLDAARGAAVPAMTAEDGWWAQMLAEAARLSADEHRPIEIIDAL
jgi:predicted dehydrogenase/threonine dehydrogenase-like Zn-dependent dehydrogenase